MGRVDKFKEVRRFKTKCISMMVIFLILVLTGVCVSDYSINTLMKNQKKITFIEMEQKEDSHVLIKFLNLGINLDTSHKSKDFEYIKGMLRRIFG